MNENKRLAFLEALLSSGKADSFARYALALEYEKGQRVDEAIATFDGLRAADPEYLPMYYMAGRLLSTAGQRSRAIEWLEAGAALAERKGDGKAHGEIEGLLVEVRAQS